MGNIKIVKAGSGANRYDKEKDKEQQGAPAAPARSIKITKIETPKPGSNSTPAKAVTASRLDELTQQRARLLGQRNTRVFDKSKGASVAELSQRISSLDDEIAKEQKASGTRTVDRLGNIFKAAGKQSSANYSEGAANLYAQAQGARDRQNQEYVDLYTRQLERARRDYESMMRSPDTDPRDIRSQQNIIVDLEKKLDAYGTASDLQKGTVESVWAANDQLQASGQKDAEKAKEGLGAFGSLLVDAGIAGAQMAGDAAAAAATGLGGGLVIMGGRVFGSGAQEARQGGATLDQQTAFGLGSAVVSMATERISNAAKPFAKLFGKGATDDLVESAISKAVERFAKTSGGKAALEMALRSGSAFAGEGIEEFLESVASPILKRMTYDKSAQFDLEEAVHSFLVGGIMGLAGSSVDVVQRGARYLRESGGESSVMMPGEGAGGQTTPQTTKPTVDLDTEQTRQPQVIETPDSVVVSDTVARLHDSGVKVEQAAKVAEVIEKIAEGKTPNSSEIKNLGLTNPAVRAMLKEKTGIDIPAGSALGTVKQYIREGVARIQSMQMVRTTQEAAQAQVLSAVEQETRQTQVAQEAAQGQVQAAVEQQKQRVQSSAEEILSQAAEARVEAPENSPAGPGTAGVSTDTLRLSNGQTMTKDSWKQYQTAYYQSRGMQFSDAQLEGLWRQVKKLEASNGGISYVPGMAGYVTGEATVHDGEVKEEYDVRKTATDTRGERVRREDPFFSEKQGGNPYAEGQRDLRGVRADVSGVDRRRTSGEVKTDPSFGETPVKDWVKVVPPKEGSVTEEEQKVVMAYGVPSFVVSDQSWVDNLGSRYSSAFSIAGQVFFQENIPESQRGQVGEHETTHVMKQVGYQPYLDFIDRTPDMLNMSDPITLDLLQRVADHRGISLLDIESNAEKRTTLYDEFNAIVVGGAAANKTRLFTEGPGVNVFYDFQSYLSELLAIKESFKHERLGRGPQDSSAQGKNAEGEPVITMKEAADSDIRRIEDEGVHRRNHRGEQRPSDPEKQGEAVQQVQAPEELHSDVRDLSGRDSAPGSRGASSLRGVRAEGVTGQQDSPAAPKLYAVPDTEPDTAPTFYSQMQKVVAAYKGDKLGAASLESYLRGHGVKAEEIKWSGIKTFLEGKKSVTKQELLEFLRANELQIETEVLSDEMRRGPYSEDNSELMDRETGELYFGLQEALDRAVLYANEQGYTSDDVQFAGPPENIEFWVVNERGREVPLLSVETVGQSAPDMLVGGSQELTRWSQYATEGGKRYREYLYRVPGADYSNRAMDAHWGRPGVLAHARVQDMTAADGSKVLFIDEIQSDWHNAGNKEGYADPERIGMLAEYHRLTNLEYDETTSADRERRKALRRKLFPELVEKEAKLQTMGKRWLEDPELSEIHRKLTDAREDHNTHYAHNQLLTMVRPGADPIFGVVQAAGDLQEKYGLRLTEAEMNAWFDWLNEVSTLRSEIRTGQDKLRIDGVPDAPFSKSYHEFVMKNLLREAAENGYDYLAWTTAQMQADRWSSDYAEGYRIEYDQDMPKFMRKYGKQWGATVGKIDLRTKELSDRKSADLDTIAGLLEDGDDYIRRERGLLEVWAVPITAEMRDSIMHTGQPMFLPADSNEQGGNTNGLRFEGPDGRDAGPQLPSAERTGERSGGAAEAEVLPLHGQGRSLRDADGRYDSESDRGRGSGQVNMTEASFPTFKSWGDAFYFFENPTKSGTNMGFAMPPLPGIDTMEFGRRERVGKKSKWVTYGSYPVTTEGLQQFMEDLPGLVNTQTQEAKAETAPELGARQKYALSKKANAEKRTIGGVEYLVMREKDYNGYQKKLAARAKKFGGTVHFVYGDAAATNGQIANGYTDTVTGDVVIRVDAPDMDFKKIGDHELSHLANLADNKRHFQALDAILAAGKSEAFDRLYEKAERRWAKVYENIPESTKRYLLEDEVLAEISVGNSGSKSQVDPDIREVGPTVRQAMREWETDWDSAEHPQPTLGTPSEYELLERYSGNPVEEDQDFSDYEIEDEWEASNLYLPGKDQSIQQYLVENPEAQDEYDALMKQLEAEYGDGSAEAMFETFAQLERAAQRLEQYAADADAAAQMAEWTAQMEADAAVRLAEEKAKRKQDRMRKQFRTKYEQQAQHAKDSMEVERQVARLQKKAAVEQTKLAEQMAAGRTWSERLRLGEERALKRQADMRQAAQERMDALRSQRDQKVADTQLAERMNAGRKLAEAKRRGQDQLEAEKAKRREDAKLARKDAKSAAKVLRKYQNGEPAQVENKQTNTLREAYTRPGPREMLEKAADTLRTANRTFYRTFINGTQAVDNFAKKQTLDANTSTLMRVAMASNSTADTILTTNLVGRDGDVLDTQSLEDVMICWDQKGRRRKPNEEQQRILQDYMLHRHNIDRMGFREKARAALVEFEDQHPWLTSLDSREFALLVTDGNRAAQRYQELIETYQNAKDKPIFADEDGEPLSAEYSRGIVETYEQGQPWVKEKAEGIYDWWDKFMRAYAVGDSVSEAQYDTLRQMYPAYVPTYRKDKGGWVGGVNTFGGTATAGKAIRKATGGTSAVANIEDSYVRLMKQIVSNARANEVLRSIVDTAMLDTDGDFLSDAIFDWDAMPELSRWDAATAGVEGALEAKTNNDAAKALQEENGEYRVNAWVNGEQLSTYVSEDLYKALDFAFNDRSGWFVQLGRKLTSPMKTFITGINPGFALRNVIRDNMTAQINSMAAVNSISGIQFEKYYAQAWKEIATRSDNWKRFNALGGTNAAFQNNEGGDYIQKLKGRSRQTLDPLKATGKVLGSLGEITESATRFAEYLATIDRLPGGDTYANRLQGIKNAAEVTVDFSRKGTAGKAFNAWIPYWNPAVQGIDKVFHQFYSQPGVVKKAKVLGRAAMTTLPLDILLYALYEYLDRDDEWEELNDRTKDTYYCIPLRDEHKFLKIPKSRDWGQILGNPIMRLVQGYQGREDPFANYFEVSLAPNFLWSNPMDALGISWVNELEKNEDFAGRTIVPYAYQNSAKGDQWNDETSKYAKAVADLGNQFTKEDWLSPMQIDYIINDYFGDFGQMFNRLFSIGGNEEGLTAEEQAKAVAEDLFGNWTADNRYQSATVSDYYDMMDKLDQEISELKNRDPEGYTESAAYKLSAAISYGEGPGAKISELNAKVRGLPDGKEKDQAKQEILDLAREALELYDRVQSGEVTEPKLEQEYAKYGSTVSRELLALNDYADTYSFKPSTYKPSTYADPNREGFQFVLDDAAKDKYREFYDAEYQAVMEETMRSGRYQKADNEKKAELLEAARDDVSKHAREETVRWMRKSGYKSERKK